MSRMPLPEMLPGDVLETIREHEEAFQIMTIHGIGDHFWCELLDELYRRLKQRFHECGQLDAEHKAICTTICRKFLQETALSVVSELKNASKILDQRSVTQKRSFHREDKDFWCISPVKTLVAYDNEHGRNTASFPVSKDSVHPRSFICYGFTASLEGRKYLEKEARALWADGLIPPISQCRRYSEFYRLHRDLVKHYKYRIGASAKIRLAVVPRLPPKSSLSLTSAHDEQFVKGRRRALEVWLHYMSLHRIVSISLPFRNFMLNAPVDTIDIETASIESGSTYAASLQSSMVQRFSQEDPIVARRARKQLDEVLARYGSGPVALSAISATIPPLENALRSARLATKNLVAKSLELQGAKLGYGQSLNEFSQNVQKIENAKIGWRRDPVNYLGVALSNRSNSEPSETIVEENWRMVDQSLKIFAKNVIPELKSHVTGVKSSNLLSVQEESFAKMASPAERIASEWHEVSQIRTCMLIKAAEDVAQSSIAQAQQSIQQWEDLKQKLLAFDVDAFIEESGDVPTPLRTASSATNPFSDNAPNQARRPHNVVSQPTAVHSFEEWLAMEPATRALPPAIFKPQPPKRCHSVDTGSAAFSEFYNKDSPVGSRSRSASEEFAEHQDHDFDYLDETSSVEEVNERLEFVPKSKKSVKFATTVKDHYS